MLLGRNPAVDQSLPKRSECLFAILVRSKSLGPLVVCQHALTIVREAVIKSSALLWLPLQWTWATAARKDCYPDRRARQDLQLRTGGRPERRSCRCPYAFQGQESSRHNTAISRWHRVCVRLGQNCGKGCRVAASTQLVVIAHHPSGESLRPRTQMLGDLLLEPTPPTARDGLRHIAIGRDRILSRGQLRVGRE